jgi:hypothetical protein
MAVFRLVTSREVAFGVAVVLFGPEPVINE